mmetsp:Transcript_19251/g.44290  ORF Transcript_19251/g.44290 Transcript_19251/m.44290 type:complete len:218 (+) Transcript_19251:133-786(+)
MTAMPSSGKPLSFASVLSLLLHRHPLVLANAIAVRTLANAITIWPLHLLTDAIAVRPLANAVAVRPLLCLGGGHHVLLDCGHASVQLSPRRHVELKHRHLRPLRHTRHESIIRARRVGRVAIGLCAALCSDHLRTGGLSAESITAAALRVQIHGLAHPLTDRSHGLDLHLHEETVAHILLGAGVLHSGSSKRQQQKLHGTKGTTTFVRRSYGGNSKP